MFRVPPWLNIKRQMVPDLVTTDPQQCPVWEITGAEFSKAELHTAGGISIRFPRVTKERSDKTWTTATSLQELRNLYDESKNNIDIDIKTGSDEETDTGHKRKSESPVKASSGKKAKTKKSDKNENSFSEEDKMMTTGVDTDTVSTTSGFTMTEVRGDLFSAPPDNSLCHCVSRDFRLGKGIAKLFKNKFGRIDELKSSGAGVGQIAVLEEKKRFIYNLVTKEVYSGKPTYESLRKTLQEMKSHAVKHEVTKISMPLIGCGLDGLNWPKVRALVEEIFQEENINITVYSLDNASPSTSESSRNRNIADMFKGKSSQDTEKQTTPRQTKLTEIGFGYSTANVLPDVFVGMKVHVSGDVEDKVQLERYLVSYGGRVLAEYQLAEATHIVYSQSTSKRRDCKSAKHVALRWLVDSIKMKHVQDERLYKVR